LFVIDPASNRQPEKYEPPIKLIDLSHALEIEVLKCQFVFIMIDVAEPGPLSPRTSSDGEHRKSEDSGYAQAKRSVAHFLTAETGISEAGAQQLAEYFVASFKALGVVPSQKKIVIERFFDESGGMQLVIHSPFGIRINRAWGLALRKRFCRSFNFELQAAATDDAIVLSLGTQHSFPLEEVFRYLHSKTVREVLVQALLDAPMFPIRWRWNATRALALPRQRGGRKVPAPLQRMESENLLAAVFPDQLACLENIAGDREVPDHPLVQQTIEDCLTEAMDIAGLEHLLEQIERGEIQCIALDLPEPSPLAHEILNARPYAFLDDAPLEERRTHAVLTRRSSDSFAGEGLGVLDTAAIEKVCSEAWPLATNADELHEALLLTGLLTDEEMNRVSGTGQLPASTPLLESLIAQKRVARLTSPHLFWVAAERISMVQAIYPTAKTEPNLTAPDSQNINWERAPAIRELIRGRMEIAGPITTTQLAGLFHLSESEIDAALLALEAEGFILRGKFHKGTPAIQWCDRRLLSRIHRLTINRLRAEIQPVSIGDFQRFLFAWQRVAPEHRAEGPEGVEAVLEMFDGYEMSAAAWEPEVLALRVKDYTPQWLDQLCFTGRIGWGRLSPAQNQNGRPFAPLRSSPVSLFSRENFSHWLLLSPLREQIVQSPDTETVLAVLLQFGALFFNEIVKRTTLLPSRAEQALAELVTQGLVTSDSFEGLRALLTPQEKRLPFADLERKRRHRPVTSVEYAGRWSLLRPVKAQSVNEPSDQGLDPKVVEHAKDNAIEVFARTLVHRYGVVFRRLLEGETLKISWYELGRIYRRLEARGEIRGGHFVSGVSGEQFALPEAIGLMRSIRKNGSKGEMITLSGADPLNLTGILMPGRRVSSIAANRILFRDGVPLAALEANKINYLSAEADGSDAATERTLRIGTLPPALRRYYS
jgi:ATP-dependent helicase Lhr and Lhr-like helicase